MLEAKDYNDFYVEASESHKKWQQNASREWAFHNGNQWDSKTLDALKRQKRPHLTLNHLRSLVRLLVGYEQRTRYDLKVFPIGETGDDEAESSMIKISFHENLEFVNDLFAINPNY